MMINIPIFKFDNKSIHNNINTNNRKLVERKFPML